MYLEQETPAGYIPYSKLGFCSNSFNSVRMPLVVAGFPPVLVGSGSTPRIWLSATLGKGVREWATVVKDNHAQFPGVIIKKLAASVQVFTEKKLVLHVIWKSQESADVVFLDLRPLGFNIHGNKNKLWIGTNEFSRNTISNCSTGIAIGA